MKLSRIFVKLACAGVSALLLSHAVGSVSASASGGVAGVIGSCSGDDIDISIDGCGADGNDVGVCVDNCSSGGGYAAVTAGAGYAVSWNGVAALGYGDAYGVVAVTGEGAAYGNEVAVAGNGFATGEYSHDGDYCLSPADAAQYAIAGTFNACGNNLAISGTNDAVAWDPNQGTAVSGTGNATGGMLAVSGANAPGTSQATATSPMSVAVGGNNATGGEVAVSVTGTAKACQGPFPIEVSATFNNATCP